MFKFSILLIVPGLFFISCDEQQNTEIQIPNANAVVEESVSVESQWSFVTFQNEDDSWGYQILNENNLYINQPHIPAVQGNKGFTTQERAEITANFVIFKLESGWSPPSLTLSELDSLGVIN